MEKDSPSDSSQPSPFKRVLQFLRLIKTPDTAEDLEQEIQEILEDGEEQGLITRQEGEMINSIFELRDTLTREIMTPQTNMVCAPETASIQDIVGLITSKGFSRIPIYSKNPDHIIGVLHAKDLLHYCSKSEPSPTTAGDIIKPAYFISENEKIEKLLKAFQTQKMHIAIVNDEFGSVRGLITLEDILEEIVGEITDEYDKDERHLKKIDKYTLLCDARLDIEEIEEYFNVQLPEGPYESVGGLIIHSLGRVPEPGSFVDVNSLTFYVLSSTNRRINRVKITKSKQ
jgi:CBS domain containing-hemolysin-like protein